MRKVDLTTPVAQCVIERPSRARVFERLGIDYCCGGKEPLARACETKGLDPRMVLEAIEREDAKSPAAEERDWSRATLTELADHIENVHHSYLREELPRLASLIEEVVRAHGERHAELLECRDVFDSLRHELEAHLFKEERILFPMIRDLEASATLPDFHCGTLRNPIRVMEHEHDGAALALSRLRELTGDYAPPDDACNTYRAAFTGLAELEADLHRHIHKENNILFPRAVAEESPKPQS
ncbi:MAG: iron-sulfur cluster repair di-iron protein [Myxococcota bacterium]